MPMFRWQCNGTAQDAFNFYPPRYRLGLIPDLPLHYDFIRLKSTLYNFSNYYICIYKAIFVLPTISLKSVAAADAESVHTISNLEGCLEILY